MRLRTFESFWLLKNGLLYTYPSVQKNLSAEIVVIGGGITGALTSHALMDKGYKVTLIDKRDIGQGSSSATTSMLQYEIDVPLSELSNMIGAHAASQCYKAGIQAIKKLEQLVKEKKIDCGFEKKESLYIAHSEKSAQSLKEEFEIRNKCELGVKWLSAEEVSKSYGLKSFGGILSETAASIDAYKLAHELIHYNSGRGMHVYDQTELIDFDFGPKKTTITSSEGHKISCKKVIFCSGFESTKMIKEEVAKLFYTYACVSEKDIKIPKKLRKTLVWDTNDPYLYMRTTDDGRLLVGGEDSSVNFPFFQQQIKESKTSKLMQTLQEMMPDINFIEDFSWGGTFGSTKDGLPYIGKSPEFEHALFVLSFGGNGITFSIQAMDIIVDLLEDKPNELADYYRFGR
ncbi:MAG: FAD-dependent oxidoreductase [Saprospiraceae bacterium]